MNKETLREWIETGRELEFTYKENEFSITYYNDGRKDYISFCKWDDEEVLDVPNVDALWDSTYKGMKFSDIWESISFNDISVC